MLRSSTSIGTNTSSFLERNPTGRLPQEPTSSTPIRRQSISPVAQCPIPATSVNGAAQAHDAALTTASAELKWLNGFSLAATFEGEFSGTTASYAGNGVVRYAW
jgi:hypothetical protein